MTITLARSYGEEQSQLQVLKGSCSQTASWSGGAHGLELYLFIYKCKIGLQDLRDGSCQKNRESSASGQEGFCALNRGSFCSSMELKKMPSMHRSIKSLLIRKHNILTLTRSVVVVHDFRADMIKLHSSHCHSLSILSPYCFTNTTERIGCFPFLPPQSKRCPGREESRFHRNCHLFSTTTQDSRETSVR